MHVAMVIGAGLVALGLFVLCGWLWGASTAGMAQGARWFMPVWLVIALVNLWVGVAHAGYTVRQEAPILVLVVAVPVVIAGIVAWQLSKG